MPYRTRSGYVVGSIRKIRDTPGGWRSVSWSFLNYDFNTFAVIAISWLATRLPDSWLFDEKGLRGRS
jgi:hypothetical protein